MVFKTIKLVTDSVADLPQDLIDQWDITVVPFAHSQSNRELPRTTPAHPNSSETYLPLKQDIRVATRAICAACMV